MLYATLFNIITAINRDETDSCTLQIVREPHNVTQDDLHYRNLIYGDIKLSSLVDFAIEVMQKESIPIISVDLMNGNEDEFMSPGFNYGSAFKLLYIRY